MSVCRFITVEYQTQGTALEAVGPKRSCNNWCCSNCICPQLFLPVLFLLSDVLYGALVVKSDPTYEYTNQNTGEILTCNMCPPGTHMTAHCTATAHTQCAPCRNSHFTELWNYLPRCLYCSTLCTENQEVEKECSPVNDRVCRCKEGFYWNDDFCATHTECGPGYGVQTKGRRSIVSSLLLSEQFL